MMADVGNDKTLDLNSFDSPKKPTKKPKVISKDDKEKVEVQNEITSHAMLPSILDSKIWKLNCLNGQERSLVAKLLKKAIDFLNQEKPFMILSVFNCDKTPGCIYIEAHNMSHVLTFIHGI